MWKSQPLRQPRSTTIFMKATINVVCYKWKVLVNGESPLMLRISKDQKRTMRSLGISVNPKHWDFVKNEPKTSCPIILLRTSAKGVLFYFYKHFKKYDK